MASINTFQGSPYRLARFLGDVNAIEKGRCPGASCGGCRGSCSGREDTLRKPGAPPPFAALRFAVYARRSTEGARHEDHKGMGRLVEQGRRYGEARGGEVLADHIYWDEGTSGAVFQDRPGLLRFLNALENGKPINALMMMDDDRLGRNLQEQQGPQGRP